MVEKFKSRNLRRPSRQMLSQKGEKHVAMDSRQRGMVGNRTGTPHKCFRTNGCKIFNPDVHKESLKFNYSYSDEQQSCPTVSS